MKKETLLFVSTLMVASVFALADPKMDPKCQVDSTSNVTKPQHYNFKNCILAEFIAQIDLGPQQIIHLVNGSVNEKETECGPDNSNLIIDFDCAQLKFSFFKKDGRFYLADIAGMFNYSTSPSTNITVINVSNLDTKINVSDSSLYKCSTTQKFPIVEGSNTTLTLTDVKLEAFRDTSKESFYKSESQCYLDDSDWVRYAVFICLASLVAIVLVAYFIGRRRWSERSSYESV